ncbi:Bug family tripartite tricarboxylate transporter substrate binding protein [Roseococcus sp. YIM B11640]|uniref:Bug family tripartite tricarboxylate transporter substrate binding protein n=1 Tax=Roseococcus sp. YIM B11640 TaxID=3133973 RepID=UPI003C79CBCA
MLASPSILRAQGARSIRVVVPFPPGGGVDVFARPFSAALSTVLGQPVVVENIGGASSRLGNAAVARAPGDGLTLLVTNDTLAAVEALPIAGSPPALPQLVPVLRAAASPHIIVTGARSDIADIAGYVARLRDPARWPNHAVPGLSTAHHFASALLWQAVGGQAEVVPYRGGGPIIAELISGTVDAALLTLSTAIAQVQAGQLRGLAVTSATRAAAVPDVPTIAETVSPGFEVTTWMGVLAPGATPPETVARLHQAGQVALRDPALRDRLAAVGFDPLAESQEAFAALLRATVERFAVVAHEAGIRGDAS